jgi:hypothetical protein
VEDTCENGNEPFGFIKYWKIHKVAEQLVASQEGLISIELVVYGTVRPNFSTHLNLK